MYNKPVGLSHTYYLGRFEWHLERLWLPRGSSLPTKREWMERNFPSSLREASVVFKAEEAGGNILTREALVGVSCCWMTLML